MIADRTEHRIHSQACNRVDWRSTLRYAATATRQFTQQLAQVLQVAPELYLLHDVMNQQQTEALFAAIQKKWGRLDVMLHAMAFAPKTALHAPVLDCSLQDF